MVPQGRRQQDAAGAPYRVMRRSLSILKRSSDWLHLHIKLKNKDVFGLLTKTLNCPCSPHVQTFKKIKKKKTNSARRKHSFLAIGGLSELHNSNLTLIISKCVFFFK